MFKAITRLFKAEVPDKKPTPIMGEAAVVDATEYLFGDRNKAFTRYNPSALITRKGLSIIDKMRDDDQVKAAITFKKNTVIANGWEIVSPEGKEPDWEVTVFVRDVLKNMRGTFERRLLDMLTALDYGYSVTEKVWEQKDGKVVLAAIKTKRPNYIDFSTDAYGNLMGIQQAGNDLPVDKFIVYSYDMEFENWYGTPDLQAAYRSWWSKDNTYKWMAMLLERMGIPPIFALYNSNFYQGANLTALQQVLQNLQSATTASIPFSNDKENGKSIEFWAPELAKNVADVFIPALDMYNKDIARAILMPGLLGMTPDAQAGSYARSQVHFDVFLLVIERIRAEVQEYILQEQIIKPLVDMNFILGPDDEYPQFNFLPLTDDLRIDLLKTWKDLVSANVVKAQDNDEDHIRKLFDFPERDLDRDEDEVEDDEDTDLDPDQLPPVDEATGDEQLDDGESKGETEKKDFAISFSRAKNGYEKKVDFQQIHNTIAARERALIDALRLVMLEEQQHFIFKLRKGIEPDSNLRPSFMPKLQKVLKDGMLAAAKDGRNDILSMKKFKADVGYITSVAERWVVARATTIAGIMSGKLIADIALTISNSIRSGTPIGTTISQIEDIMLPYIGNDNIIEDGEVIEPYRIETIVRTNTTTAFNQGRLAAIRDPDVALFMQAVEYSAIMDERTTDICDHLDGRVFKIDDPDLDRLTPPNHFNCRSVLVPITVEEKIDAKDFLSAQDKGKAIDLAGRGFV